MFSKVALLSAIMAFSGVANAGLFDSNDFKCGREDAVKALADYIKNDASGILQSGFITKDMFNYDKPIAVYQNMLDSMNVTVTNVSTSGDGSNGLNCSANIAVNVPQNTLDVVSKMPDFLDYVTGNYGKINSSGVMWSGVTYRAKLADNKKDILFSDFNKTDIPRAMRNISVLAVNKDQIITAVSENSLNSAQESYARVDRELNAVWKALPDSARNAMKKEQLAWVNDKVAKCGKLSDGKSEALDMQQRVNIYQCQTKMTHDRIAYLTGNDNSPYRYRAMSE